MKKHDLNELVFNYRKEKSYKNNKILYSLLFIGWDIVFTTLICGGIGFIIDKYLYTKPAFMLSLSLIGFLSGFKKIFKKLDK